jgi:hypothetical protein
MNDKDIFRLDEPISFTLDLCQEGKRANDLYHDVEAVLGTISKMFRAKNEQYRSADDDLANFTTGAMLRYGKADMPARFEALKDYVSKHIAKVYNGKLLDDKMDESILDIAVYFIIAAVMHKRAKQGE